MKLAFVQATGKKVIYYLVIINSSSPYLIVESFKVVQFKQQVIFIYHGCPSKILVPLLSSHCLLAAPLLGLPQELFHLHLCQCHNVQDFFAHKSDFYQVVT